MFRTTLKNNMKNPTTIQTTRLLLRQWQASDSKPFAQLNADDEVMQFFPNTLTEEQSNKMAEKIQGLIAENGYGFWAVELVSTSEFIGFVGLNQIKADTELAKVLSTIQSPFLEIGWRLAKAHWGVWLCYRICKGSARFCL